MLSEMTFLVGYIPAGFTEKKQALHDIIAVALCLGGLSADCRAAMGG